MGLEDESYLQYKTARDPKRGEAFSYSFVVRLMSVVGNRFDNETGETQSKAGEKQGHAGFSPPFGFARSV